MKIQYLGTAAAEGIPAVFCNCAFCREMKALGGKNIRTRAQLLIDGELSIDFPPDAYYHMLKSGLDLSAVKYLLVTHSHMDHFYASDFVLRGGVYAHDMTSPTLEIYANREVIEIYRESTRRELHQSIGDTIGLHPIMPFEKVEFGEYAVYTLEANHNSKEPMIFLIEKDGKRVLHLHDTGKLPDSTLEYLKKLGGAACDLVNFDCTFVYTETYEGARHMGLDEVARTTEMLKAIGLVDEHTVRVITHFSHNNQPTEELLARAEREYGVIAAYDGMIIEL